jgi:hypothetical protein
VKNIAKEAGIRVLGPNCLGVYDSSTGVDMLFLPETRTLTTGEEVVATPRPRSGPIAVVTQSGAFGVAVLDYMAGEEIGLSKFVASATKSTYKNPKFSNTCSMTSRRESYCCTQKASTKEENSYKSPEK